MKELLAPLKLKTSAKNINVLSASVIGMAYNLKNAYPDIPLVFVGGPITSNGPEMIPYNLSLLRKIADLIHLEGALTYTNPYVGRLSRFSNISEGNIVDYTLGLLRSCVFDELVLREGWEFSAGSVAEYKTAQELGMPVRTYHLKKLRARKLFSML